jgi:outer membrane protein assembly factor BamA
MVMKFKLLLFINLLLFVNQQAYPKKFINNIFIEKKNVFDSTQSDWFFASEFANSLHYLTRDYVIEDELLFFEGDTLNKDKIYETVRNLRNTGFFTDVAARLDSLDDRYYDVYLTTQDRWSTLPIFIFGTGGNTTNIGGGIEELNLLGTGTHIRMESYHRSENQIGWQGGLFLTQRRLLRSDFYFDFGITANEYRTDQSIVFGEPFRNIEAPWSYGISAINSYGRDFLYKKIEGVTTNEASVNYELMPFHNRDVYLWLSRSWLKNDRVFASFLLQANDVNRGRAEFERAFDNSGKLLVSFSSVAEDYFQTSMLNTYQKEDVPIGGWGAATLGKIFPIGSQGKAFYYIAGQGEKSYLFDKLYFFGQVTGASAFSHGFGYYTYEEFLGKAFYRFSKNLLIASRIRQQTVWNWSKLRQLILDNDGGLRGYEANKLAGDNRFVVNTELRAFPEWQFWIVKLSGVLFWDFGTVWEQNTRLFKTQWHNSAGFGLRFFNTKATGDDSIFRLDFAFNFDERKFGAIIFTTDQLFSVFERHRYKIPQVYGTEFDYE